MGIKPSELVQTLTHLPLRLTVRQYSAPVKEWNNFFLLLLILLLLKPPKQTHFSLKIPFKASLRPWLQSCNMTTAQLTTWHTASVGGRRTKCCWVALNLFLFSASGTLAESSSPRNLRPPPPRATAAHTHRLTHTQTPPCATEEITEGGRGEDYESREAEGEELLSCQPWRPCCNLKFGL